jgi:hypothetical protein
MQSILVIDFSYFEAHGISENIILNFKLKIPVPEIKKSQRLLSVYVK